MALDTLMYAAQGRLILNPTSYSGGGDDLGMAQSGHLVGVDFTMDVFDRQPGGSMAQEAAITGVNAVYTITLLDLSSKLLNLLFRGMAGVGTAPVTKPDTFQQFNNYKLGHLLGADQLFKLQIRPVADDGATPITTKPTVYFPRAAVMSVLPIVWHRGVEHFAATELKLLALKSSSYQVPFLYGDPADLPAIV
jgi:hypothetical protein